MKLLLTSSGLRAAPVMAALEKLCGNPRDQISCAIINEAYAVELGDKRWLAADIRQVMDNCGGEVDFVNLLALSLERVRQGMTGKDVVIVLGGHTDYLMSVFTKTGFARLLPELLQTKVYVASSVGSMVLGRRVRAAAYQRVYGETEDYGVTAYLELVDFALKPHFESALFPNNRAEVLTEVCRDEPGRVYGLRDDNPVVVDGEQVSFVAGEPYAVHH